MTEHTGARRTTREPVVSASALQAALDARAVFGRMRRRLSELSVGGELSPSQASALMRLSRGGVSTASALAHAERVRPQSMAAILAALEERGLVTRTQDPSDGRRQILDLTEVGMRHVEGARDAGQEWFTMALQHGLTESERGTVIAAMALLERVLA